MSEELGTVGEVCVSRSRGFGNDMAAVVVQAAVARHAIRQAERERLWPEIQRMFREADKDRDGSITFIELKTEIVKHVKAHQLGNGNPLGTKKFKAQVNGFDKSGEGKYSYDLQEFANIVCDMHANPSDYFEEPAAVSHMGSCLGKKKKLPYQDKVFHIYNHPTVVNIVAIIIVANFIVNIIEKEIDADPDDMKYTETWVLADNVFNIIFIFELTANIYSHGGPIRIFWASGWNIFDTVIVTVSFLTMINALQPPLDQLKLLRAFRVFRLFKRVQSLNKIIVALIRSIPGVANAFLVMLIFFCIYAILAVELFRDFGKDGYYVTYNEVGNRTEISAETPRGLNTGLEYYGTFMRALFTLFQVMTGDSWAEAIARPLLFGFNRSLTLSAIITGAYYVSFVILTNMVLINVVVAVLLDKFVEQPQQGNPPVDESNTADENPGGPSSTGALGEASVGSPGSSQAGSPTTRQPLNPQLEMHNLLARLAEATEMITAQQAQIDSMQRELAEISTKVSKANQTV